MRACWPYGARRQQPQRSLAGLIGHSRAYWRAFSAPRAGRTLVYLRHGGTIPSRGSRTEVNNFGSLFYLLTRSERTGYCARQTRFCIAGAIYSIITATTAAHHTTHAPHCTPYRAAAFTFPAPPPYYTAAYTLLRAFPGAVLLLTFYIPHLRFTCAHRTHTRLRFNTTRATLPEHPGQVDDRGGQVHTHPYPTLSPPHRYTYPTPPTHTPPPHLPEQYLLHAKGMGRTTRRHRSAAPGGWRSRLLPDNSRSAAMAAAPDRRAARPHQDVVVGGAAHEPRTPLRPPPPPPHTTSHLLSLHVAPHFAERVA